MRLACIPRLLIVGLVAVCTLVPGSAAFANPPSREPVSFGTFTVSGACSFDFQIEALSGKGEATTFYDRAGNVRLQLFTGAARLRYTNLSTGQSFEVTNSSSARVVTDADGTTTVTITGPWGGDQTGGVVPGFPGAWTFNGRVVLTIDAAGNLVSVTHTPGPVTDVCAALAG